MRIRKSRRGVGLVEVVVAIFLLGTVGTIFAVTFSAGFKCTRQAQEYKVATAIAQRKMEQLRAMNYESLTYTHLHAAGAIDNDPGSSPYSFTSVESLSNQLPSPTGTLTVEDIEPDVRRVTITIAWQGSSSPEPRNVRLMTYFADKRPRAVD